MPRNHGHDDEGDRYDGSGGASGRYGSQTPLDPLHRRGVFEQGERERQQSELDVDPTALDRARAPFDAER